MRPLKASLNYINKGILLSRLFLLPILTHFVFHLLPTRTTVKITFNQIFLFLFKDKASICREYPFIIPTPK